MVIFKYLNIGTFSLATYVISIFFVGTCNLLTNWTLIKLCMQLGLIETTIFSLWIQPWTCNIDFSHENKLLVLFLSLFFHETTCLTIFFQIRHWRVSSSPYNKVISTKWQHYLVICELLNGANSLPMLILFL